MSSQYRPLQYRISRPALSILLCLALIAMNLTFFAQPTEAKSSRAAKIIEISDNVTVKKAGGSKEYPAYQGMTVNEGDFLSTDENGSVVLRILDSEDEVTIGASSEVYISSLVNKGGKKSKFKMWAGSLMSKVKKLVGDDQFEVETPTAAMGVRGTNYAINVNPVTGESTATTLSGFIEAVKTDANGDPTNNRVLVLPSQQLTTGSGNNGNIKDGVTVVSTDDLAKSMTQKMIEQLLQNKQAIDQENKEFFDQAQQLLAQGGQSNDNSVLVLKTLEDLNKVKQNLDNLVSNVVKSAVTTGVIDQGTANKLVDTINKSVPEGQKIDLSKVPTIDRTAGLSIEQLNAHGKFLQENEIQRQRLVDEQKVLSDKLKQQLGAALAQLEADKKRKDEANRQAELDRQKKAEADYFAALSAAEQDRFKKDQKGDQPPSNTDNTTPTQPPVLVDTTPPAAPSGLHGIADDTKVTLSWNPSTESDLASYNVYKGSEKIKNVLKTQTSLVSDQLTNGTTYTFTVTAVDTSGNESLQSSPVTVTPYAPVVVEAIANFSSFTSTGQNYNVTLKVSGATAPNIYGAEVHVTTAAANDISGSTLDSNIFLSNSPYSFKTYTGISGGNSIDEAVIAAISSESAGHAVGTGQILFKFSVFRPSASDNQVKLIKLMLVDKNGDPIHVADFNPIIILNQPPS